MTNPSAAKRLADLRRRFNLVKWERVEAWLVVKTLLVLSAAMLRALRFLFALGLVSDGAVERGIRISGRLASRSHAVWRSYIAKRNQLKAEADAFWRKP